MEGCGAKERMVLLSTKSKLEHYECEGQLSIFDIELKEPELFMNPPEEPKPEIKDDYIRENPTCFYVFGHYLDSAEGWHKVPDQLPTFTEWTLVNVVVFGKKTGTAWMEHGKWEAKDWTFRSIDERRNTETTEVLAWCIADKEDN